MKTKFVTFFLLLALVTTVFANNRTSKVDKKTQYGVPNENNKNVIFPGYGNVPMVPLSGQFITGDAIIGPEISTTITGWYDYMTNGDCRHYIQVDKSNPLLINVIYTVSDSLEPVGTTSRRTKYATSTDGGATWSDGGNIPSDLRTGFGYMILKPTGEAVVGMHAGTVVNTQLHIDIAPQAATWQSYNANLPARIWPQVSILTNGNMLLVANQNTTVAPDSLVFGIFNGTSISNWSPVIAYTPVSNQRWGSAAGTNGNAVIISNPVSVVDSLNSNFVRMFLTTDNGTSWSGPTNVFRPFVDGTDTVTPFFGQDVIYKPGTSNWYYVLNAIGSRFRTCKLYMVRSTNLTPVLIADSNNVPIMTSITDGKSIAGVTGIDHPSLGWSEDGNVLYCAYSVSVQDTGARGWNTRDIFYQYSTNDGSSWSAPVRITNTPTIDEGYVSISQWNKGTSAGTYELNIQYMKDPGDGPTSFNGTNPTAPATRNQQIYRKITISGPDGISNISGEVPHNFSLEQNYPNPFNPSTTIRFAVPKSTNVTIEVFDIAGRLVRTLANNEFVTPGVKEVSFDASQLSSGIYFYTLKAANFTETKKMILVK